MNHGLPFFAPSVRFEFWAPMRPRTRCQPNSARSLVHHEFPSTCVLPPSLPCPPFPPISKSHISPARSPTHFLSLNNYPLVFFWGLALLRRSRIPIYSFRDPAFFPFPAAAHTSLRVRLARSHLRSVNEVLTHPFCLKYFRLDVYYHATSNTHGTQIDRSCDF
jgi:hypothetical protein